MPCGALDFDRQPGYQAQQEVAHYKQQANALCAEADLLREALIYALQIHPELQDSLDERVVGSVVEKQVEHRSEDLKRLEKVFIKSKNTKFLQKVWEASPLKPLAPQLGFDPDSY